MEFNKFVEYGGCVIWVGGSDWFGVLMRFVV
jgi:hypothetical protein